MPYRLVKEITLQPTYKYNETLFTNDSSTKYYLIGLILADGYISKDNYRIEIALKESDKPYLEMIRDLIAPGKPLKYKQHTKAYRFSIDNKIIYTNIMKFVNELPKSTSLIFPYGIPDTYILDFIRGYSDGDGNIGVKRGQRKFNDGNIKYYYGLRYRILGTKNFLMGLEANLRRLGITTNRVNIHKKQQENVYYIEYGFSTAKDVLTKLYENAPIKLDRKYRVFEKISNTDSDTLHRVYGTPECHYNMQESQTSDKV